MSIFHHPKGTIILSRDGKLQGKVFGGHHLCKLEGCRGSRVGVLWPDGKRTYPCDRALAPVTPGTYRIE